MATIVSALQDATTELHNAALALNDARATFVAQSTQNLADTQAIVTKGITSPTWFLDPVNGNDANDGLSYATSRKTLHSIISTTGLVGNQFINLFGDLVHQHWTTTLSSFTVRGCTNAGNTSGDGYAYAPAKRKITFRPEALNSPIVFTGGGQSRCTSGIVFQQAVQFLNCDFYIADLPAGTFPNNVHFRCLNSSDLIIQAGNIYASGLANQNGYFIQAASPAPVGFWFGGVVDATAAGRMFLGVAVGANPNNNKQFNTNLTTN
jgi:hypothetical protein